MRPADSSARPPLGGVEASLALGKVTLTRALRTRALWVGFVVAFLPELFAGSALRSPEITQWEGVVRIWIQCLGVLVPVLLASSIGEELEEKTMTYLWSRPLPRWSILTGKLTALVPLLWAFMAAALLLPWFTVFGQATAGHGELLTRGLIAVVVGGVAVAAVTTALATLAPRYGMALSIAYLLFVDGALAQFDGSVSKISVLFHTRQLAYPPEAVEAAGTSVVWLVALATAWMTVAVLRIRRFE